MAGIGCSPPANPSSDPDPNDNAYAAMMVRARALVPELRDRAARTEELRRLPPETEADFQAAGLFGILQPKRVGGSEFDYVALVDFAEAIAIADASAAWTLANLASHHWMLGMFDSRAQDVVWTRGANALTASSFVFPAGRARKVEDGYRLQGRWPFSSGVDCCAWNMLAGIVSTDDEADGIEYRIFLLPRKDYRIIDMWKAAGLKGTGSNDVAVDDVFVDSWMTLSVADIAGGPSPGSVVNPNPLYALPVFALFPFVLSGVALGNARGCLDDYIEVAHHRATTYGAKLGDLQSTQIKIAEASAKIDAARLIMRSTCIKAMRDARRGLVPDMAVKTGWRRDGAYAVNLCTEAVSLLFAASGARGLFSGAPLQRQFRDANAINSHIAFSFDAAGTDYGRVALGLPSQNLTL
ncbi:Acyl-CoA dehydrogenase [Nitrobacter hamburgensis X14]|uniref:Acyl-CoA dehydrogenase n=1 Tax=Nitrobacter hamburgensis (strain DSM 10229 / NCIMB 13809 / X14) TaxID=323097 RepID=Q1QI11_NITHX|nr:acyl-CoA dehydrogenase family protein [Nitrobacter hamburgensis]ABE64136.1 Acyl-CoA dehydrogenase [Nitrobacter hamburgensis X14]